jgi:hypothetical protein
VPDQDVKDAPVSGVHEAAYAGTAAEAATTGRVQATVRVTVRRDGRAWVEVGVEVVAMLCSSPSTGSRSSGTAPP